MRLFQNLIVAAVGLLLALKSHAQDLPVIDGVIAAGTPLQLVADGYKFTEGPASDRDGNVFFTDQPNDRILRWDAASKDIETFLQPAGRSNGLFFTPARQLIACADGKNELWSINIADKTHQVLLSKYQDRLFNGPNDCWVDTNGRIYFTDPYYKRPYWNREQGPLEQQQVYRVEADGSGLTIAASDFKQPNGIIGDRDKRLLFVADIGDSKNYRFRIDDNGKLSERTLHCQSGSDGMTLDRQGRLYLTGKAGVTVFGADGQQLGVIPVPVGWTANVCFGGTQHNELFITASDRVYTVSTQTRGL